eukprot:TRINITY_DN4929_c0_g1_i1.p1 TRINITY_DN4929_c0_g1~~TRINITY_DN4929_c0_g1_i1.p1  ORF type:complete len:299 (-),score=77.29 TRINITY_DN4929_c0_g1_i1:80-916(-)
MWAANGSTSCCSTAYFELVLRPLSWMGAAGGGAGDLCVPNGYWENLGWHLANYAVAMRTHVLADVSGYGMDKCRFPSDLKAALFSEQTAWACAYAPASARIAAAPAVQFVLPVKTGKVEVVDVPGSSVVDDLRLCPSTAAATARLAAAGAPTVRLGDGRRGGRDAAVPAGLAATAVHTVTDVDLGWPPGPPASLERPAAERVSVTAPGEGVQQPTAAFRPSSSRCRSCPHNYEAVNEYYCCARICTNYGRAMDLAVTAGSPCRAGCCVKMNRKCQNTK